MALVVMVGIIVILAVSSPKQSNMMPLSQPVAPPQEPPRIELPVLKPETTYQGTWLTDGVRKRHLNGTMTCVLTNPSNNVWKGHFFGVWEGIKFSYNVEFSGTPSNLVGKANIDNNPYDWTGEIVGDSFNGTFTSPRYDGNFKLKTK